MTFAFCRVGDLDVPARKLDGVVNRSRASHRLDRCVHRTAIGGHLSYEMAKPVAVRRSRRDYHLLSVFVEHAHIQSLSAEGELRIPMIPYTQSDVFGRGRRRPRSGRRLGAYPVSSPPSRCLIDSLQALKLAVERVEVSR